MYIATSTVPKGLSLNLRPATSEMTSNNLSRWDNTLKQASLELTRIVTNHYESSGKQLRNKENQLFATRNFTADERASLDNYRQEKIRELSDKKYKKLIRDNICTSVSTLDDATSSVHSSSAEAGNIVNISSATLSAEELSVLSRGLNFCPATGGYNEFQLISDLHNFERSMRLREYFHNRPPFFKTAFFSTKHWTPPSQRDKCLDIYIRAVQRDVLGAYKKQSPFHRNVSDKEKQAIQTLASRDDIVIKPADKGGAIVIMNKADYLREAHRQLNDHTFYRHLSYDRIEEFKTKVKETLKEL